MASTSKRHADEQHDCAREPDGQFTQVSNHIYELYRPDEGPAELEIVFFHGLQPGDTSKAYLTTWTNEKNELWLTWLSRRLPHARILSVSYEANMKRSTKQGRLDMYNLGENLMCDIGAAGIGQTPGCPVILVGHSFGGLVIKEVCVQAHRRRMDLHDKQMADFLDNLGGIFFYGTPHQGTQFYHAMSLILHGSLLEYVTLLLKNAARMDAEFRDVCRRLALDHKIASVGERNKTKMKLYDAVMVPEEMARYGDYRYTLDADHFTICKPLTENSMSFKVLLQFILRILSETKEQEYAILDNFQHMPSAAIGLDSQVKQILKMLKEAKMVAIVGMGGIGKTTLAMAVFNEFCSSFDFTCFVHDVGSISGGVEAKIERAGKEMCHMGNQGSSSTAWWNRNLLLVFDGVCDDDDIFAFLEMIDKAAPESLFVLTCRKSSILNRLRDVNLYHMSFLTKVDAERLFKSYAFPNQLKIPPDLDKHVKDIVRLCDGVPLTIEVIGRTLEGRAEEEFWVEVLTVLESADKYPESDRIWTKLKLTYDRLSSDQRGMFLDVVTFFAEHNESHSWKLYEAKAAWSKIYTCREEELWQSWMHISSLL